jgi:hypothetical protein
MSSKRFVKKTENFVCANCGLKVIGNGFTDHCPKCLMSLHVDINPGDRASKCKGAMKPIMVKLSKGKWRILFQCEKCKHQKWNDAAKDDNMEIITSISAHYSE